MDTYICMDILKDFNHWTISITLFIRFALENWAKNFQCVSKSGIKQTGKLIYLFQNSNKSGILSDIAGAQPMMIENNISDYFDIC